MATATAPFSTISLLLTLYFLQGIIIGFLLAIPIYLDSRGANWKQLATFNFIAYPFSFKLVWAPIIDAIYIRRFGRRKTWLVPIQLLIGLILVSVSFYLSSFVDQLRVKLLTGIFFVVYFLLASQDICVDGWALSLLANFNLQWASTCQTVGQTFGRFIGFSGLMTFESANFTNKYIRQPLSLADQSYGLFTLDDFIRFWGIAFLLVSFCIALFQRDPDHEKVNVSLVEIYLSIFKLFKKRCIQQVALLSLLSPIGYAATYAMTNIVLKRQGVSKETLGLLGVPLIIVKILVPFIVTGTHRPLTWYYRAYIARLIMCILIAIYISFIPHILQQWYFYPILICLFLANECFIYLMLVSRVGFYARISDPRIGGTYITLLSMLGNLGASWTSSWVLYTADWIQPTTIAYPILVGICFLFGCIWLLLQYQTMMRLQTIPVNQWHLTPLENNSEQDCDDDDNVNENNRFNIT